MLVQGKKHHLRPSFSNHFHLLATQQFAKCPCELFGLSHSAATLSIPSFSVHKNLCCKTLHPLDSVRSYGEYVTCSSCTSCEISRKTCQIYTKRRGVQINQDLHCGDLDAVLQDCLCICKQMIPHCLKLFYNGTHHYMSRCCRCPGCLQ